MAGTNAAKSENDELASAGDTSDPALIVALQESLQIQADKIKDLLEQSEQLGADRELFVQCKAELRKYQDICDERLAEIMELDRWKQFVLRELGPSMEAAHHQILVYRSYVEAMNSPGHLFVTKLGQTLGRSWLGRRVRRAVNFVSALRAA